VDDDGKDVEEGKPGEVLVKGPVVTKGYHNNAKGTEEAFVDGWFSTGDVAEVRNGKFYIVDRKKVMRWYLNHTVFSLIEGRNSSNTKVYRWHPPN
jgi:long-subunit acyl-CoA synthetase (AMP-forming)